MKGKISAVGLGLAFGLATHRFRRDLAEARRRLAEPPFALRQITTSTGTLAFADLGEGRPVLVLHGNGGGWDHGVDWAQRRLGPGFRSISPSRFGYPGSTRPADATLGDQADVLVELLDELDLDQVDVASLSAGSLSAAHLAARYPDRVHRLILESPVGPTDRPLQQPPLPLFTALTHNEAVFWLTAGVPPLIAAASGAPWSRLDAPARAELREIMLTLTPVVPRADGMVFDNYVAYQEVVHDTLPWAAVSAPTLVVASADSPLPSPAEAAALLERLPQGQLLQLPSGGHLNLGHVERLRSEVRSFLMARP